MEGRVGFACTGGHNQQNAVFPSCDGIHCAVDGNALIVAGRVGALAAVIRLRYDFLLFGGQSCTAVCASLVTLDQFLLRGELIKAKLALFARQEVMLHKAVTV